MRRGDICEARLDHEGTTHKRVPLPKGRDGCDGECKHCYILDIIRSIDSQDIRTSVEEVKNRLRDGIFTINDLCEVASGQRVNIEVEDFYDQLCIKYDNDRGKIYIVNYYETAQYYTAIYCFKKVGLCKDVSNLICGMVFNTPPTIDEILSEPVDEL
jgi:hypothetical protein